MPVSVTVLPRHINLVLPDLDLVRPQQVHQDAVESLAATRELRQGLLHVAFFCAVMPAIHFMNFCSNSPSGRITAACASTSTFAHSAAYTPTAMAAFSCSMPISGNVPSSAA